MAASILCLHESMIVMYCKIIPVIRAVVISLVKVFQSEYGNAYLSDDIIIYVLCVEYLQVLTGLSTRYSLR